MKYPTLNELAASRQMIDVFGGYNHNLRIGEGEFYDMTNMTSNDYPVLSPRPRRGAYAHPTHGTPENPICMISKDALGYVVTNKDKTKATFYYNEHEIEIEVDAEHKNEPKTLISMGSYVIIMPDKYYINTKNFDDKGKIEKTFEAKTGTAQFILCKIDGEGYNVKDENISDTAPESPADLELWIDTSGTTDVLKQYSKTSSQWVSVATSYIKISFPNTTTVLTDLFATNDGLTISGITASNQLKEDLDCKTMVVWDVGADYIIVTGMLSKTATQTLSEDNPITIKRQMPIMDFIIESGNRLWGCRYGTALNGEVVNEIYASKLGDFKNWHCYAGISTDSYAATVGTDGHFTGAITHLGYPLFFKENYMHKVYGNYPANFQIQSTACRGVQKGCHKSLAIVNEVLFYKSRSAICGYDGSLPVEMSSALGDVAYSNAVAGVLGNKYYISMSDGADYHLFAYDSKKGMWHREDNTQVVEFCNCEGNLYYIDYEDNKVKTIIGKGEDKEILPVKWEAVTGIIGTDSPDKKYISRLNVRLSLDVGTRVYIQVEYDSCGGWEHLFSMTGTTLRTFTIPIRPKRCDHLRLKIIGDGEAKIYSICKTVEQGSDV